MLDPEDSALLIALVAAAEGPDPEARFLSALAERLRADGGQLYSGGLCWTHSGPGSRLAPLPDVMTGLRMNRVYTGDELPAPPLGDLRALGLPMPDQRPAWFILTRARGPFRAIDTARLAAYAPHIQQNLHLASRLAGLAAQQRVQAKAARRMGVGLVQRDAQGGPLHLDLVAGDLLARAKLSVQDLTKLWPRRDTTQEVYRHLADGLDMLVMPTPDGQIGLLRAHEMPLPDARQIAGALGVSLAEARLAQALAQGASLTDAALSLGLTTQTARFYSKQIFAKTGLSGQPALMRRIWTSALALAR